MFLYRIEKRSLSYVIEDRLSTGANLMRGDAANDSGSCFILGDVRPRVTLEGD